MAWKGDDDTTVGQRVASRDLRSFNVAGQRVYKGALGDELLSAAGALQTVTEVDGEKMTIVPTTFDERNPQHQQTFVHEMGHELFNFGEEAAQAAERVVMIMQEMDNEFSIQKGLDTIGAVQGFAPDQIQGEVMTRISADQKKTRSDQANAMQGYFGRLAQGFSHKDVVGDLAEWGMKKMEKFEQDRQFRTGESTSEDR